MKTPKTFYKYRSFDTRTLTSLCEDTLYFSNPGDFNDPLDCSPKLHCDSTKDELQALYSVLSGHRITSEIIEHIKSAKVGSIDSNSHARTVAIRQTSAKLAEITKSAKRMHPDGLYVDDIEIRLLVDAVYREMQIWYSRGVCCFSTTYTSPLLWSHYGQQHQGICIGYGTNRLPEPKPQKVVYGGNRAIKTSTLCEAFISLNLDALSEVDRDVLLRKASGWKYEAEWRLISNQGVQESPMLMTDITFGLRCDRSVMHTVVNALLNRRNKINFYTMLTVGNTFALRRRKLDINELGSYYPREAKSGEEAFGVKQRSPLDEEIMRIRGKS